MPRIARLILLNYPHHVIQRGNNKERVFRGLRDWKTYLDLVKRFSRQWACDILGYCLMRTHTHFLIIPRKETSLSKMMQGLSLCYTQYFNKKYERTGRLWESRFYSSIVDKDSYLFNVLRYIETNASRAGLVDSPERYRWSSARAHVENIRGEIVKDLNFLKENFEFFSDIDYREYLREGCSKEECDNYYKWTVQGKPIGSQGFIDLISERLNVSFSSKSRGRSRNTLV